MLKSSGFGINSWFEFMKKEGIISVGYCSITLLATFLIGYILLRLFPTGETVFASILFILMNLTPMIVACIFSILTNRCKNLWDFFKQIFFQREKVSACLLIIAIPLVYYGFSAFLHNVTYTNEGINAVLAYLPWSLLQGGLEEVGWRWYLQKQMPIKSFVLKMLVISIVWFLWHLPIYALPWITAASSNYLIFFLMILGNTFTFGVLGEKTNGSVPCVLAHMLIDLLATLMLVKSNLPCVIFLVVVEIILSLLAKKIIK